MVQNFWGGQKFWDHLLDISITLEPKSKGPNDENKLQWKIPNNIKRSISQQPLNRSSLNIIFQLMGQKPKLNIA